METSLLNLLKPYEDISITFTEIVQELGTVEYDDVNKETLFN